MVVLSKLHWFQTNHHDGTELEGISKSLMEALDRAIRAMPLEDLEISDADAFFIQYFHTINHLASTHRVCGGLYMASQKLISGHYHWVRYTNRQKKIYPDKNPRRLYSAPTNLALYYLVAAIAQAH